VYAAWMAKELYTSTTRHFYWEIFGKMEESFV